MYLEMHVDISVSCPIFTTFGIFLNIFVKIPNIKFNKHTSPFLEFQLVHVDREAEKRHSKTYNIFVIFTVNALKVSL
jgi:hypothetical protein